MHRYLLIPLTLICFTASAGIYKWVDDAGNIHYSDKEVTGAEQVELPKAVTFTPETQTAPTSKKAEPQKKFSYTKMTIVKPTMNETIHSNSGTVEVAIELSPTLRQGDSITLYLDGKVKSKGLTQTSISLTQVERGSHTVRASVMDKKGMVLISSSSVIFHLRIESGKSEDNTPKDNSESYTPDFNQDESEEDDKDADYSKDYGKDYSKDYDSSDAYKDGAEKYDSGIPSNKNKFKAGTSTYSPNYNQKK